MDALGSIMFLHHPVPKPTLAGVAVAAGRCCLQQFVRCLVFSVRTVCVWLTTQRTIPKGAGDPAIKPRKRARMVNIESDINEKMLLKKSRKKRGERVKFDITGYQQGEPVVKADIRKYIPGEGLEAEKNDVEELWKSGDRKALTDYLVNVFHQDVFHRGKKDRDHFGELQIFIERQVAKNTGDRAEIENFFETAVEEAIQLFDISQKVNAVADSDLRDAVVALRRKIESREKVSPTTKSSQELLTRLRTQEQELQLALEQQQGEVSVMKCWAPTGSWSQPEKRKYAFILRHIYEKEGLTAAAAYVKAWRSAAVLQEMLDAFRNSDLEPVIRERLVRFQHETGKNKSHPGAPSLLS